MIESKRFLLRKFVKEDALMMFNNWANDSEVTKYLTWNPHENIEVTKEYLDFVINTKQENYAIVDKKTKEVIGAISNVKESVDFSFCEVGYCLGKKFWNKGIMTEVLRTYLRYLFNEKKYKVVTASHKFDNLASGKVMIKAGLKLNNISEEFIDKFGTIKIYHYSITQEEFENNLLHNQISNFLNITIPSFNDIHELIDYLKANNFLVETFSLINSSKINILDQDDIYVLSNIDQNIVYYHFITTTNKLKELGTFIDDFYAKNQKYLISITNKTIEQVLVNMLRKRHFTISFAESCTGGLMASSIINVPGASNVINESFVTYSNESKTKTLNVKKETLDKYSVYSKQTAYEMAKGLQYLTNANVCVSITGLAGGNIPTTNDGSYNACIIIKNDEKEEIIQIKKSERGLRNNVRTRQKNYVFYQIIKTLEEKF